MSGLSTNVQREISENEKYFHFSFTGAFLQWPGNSRNRHWKMRQNVFHGLLWNLALVSTTQFFALSKNISKYTFLSLAIGTAGEGHAHFELCSKRSLLAARSRWPEVWPISFRWSNSRSYWVCIELWITQRCWIYIFQALSPSELRCHFRPLPSLLIPGWLLSAARDQLSTML